MADIDADADRANLIMATSPVQYPPERRLAKPGNELDLRPEPGQWTGRNGALKPGPQAEGAHRGAPSANCGPRRAPGAGDMSPSAEDADERASAAARGGARYRRLVLSMLSIGALTSAAQGASYYERDGYYAKDDPEHKRGERLVRQGRRGARAQGAGRSGSLQGRSSRARCRTARAPRLGRRGKDRGTPGSDEILHRPGRDLTFSAPEVGLHRRPGRRRRPHRRGARPGGDGDARLGREECRRDADEGSRDRADGARRAARRSSPPPSATTLRAISTPSSTAMPCSPTWCRARTGSGARWPTRAFTRARS